MYFVFTSTNRYMMMKLTSFQRFISLNRFIVSLQCSSNMLEGSDLLTNDRHALGSSSKIWFEQDFLDNVRTWKEKLFTPCCASLQFRSPFKSEKLWSMVGCQGWHWPLRYMSHRAAQGMPPFHSLVQFLASWLKCWHSTTGIQEFLCPGSHLQ